MKPTPVLALGLSLAVALTACGTAAMQNDTPNPSLDVKDRQPPRPQLKRNPNPTAYEITLKIEGAPGEFGSIRGFMQYETKLDDPCMPDLGGMAGTRMRLKENVPYVLEKVSQGTYRGTVYTDLFSDEDYFGLGVCHVGMVEARAELRIDDSTNASVFFDGLSPELIVAGKEKVAFFAKRHYLQGGMDRLPVAGMPDKSPAKEKWPQDELFSIRFSARRLTP